MPVNLVAVNSTTHEVIEPGSLIADFRGNVWQFVGVTSAPHRGSTGRVCVTSDSSTREFYPQVFGLVITTEGA
jgi:hypothetical protein